MDDVASILQGVEIDTSDDDTPAPSTRGFSNPDILAKAQDTRSKNRADKAPVDLLPDGTESPKGKRGRPSKRSERSLKGVETLLSAIHLMVAKATGFDDLIIEPEESHMLAEAIANLADHYKIKLDGKSGAIMGVIYAAGAVYGPRAVTIGIKLRERNKADGNSISR